MQRKQIKLTIVAHELVAAGIITPHYAHSEEEMTDTLTKSLGIEMCNEITNRVLKYDLSVMHLI